MLVILTDMSSYAEALREVYMYINVYTYMHVQCVCVCVSVFVSVYAGVCPCMLSL